MTTRIRWIVLLILGLIASGVLNFLPGIAEKLTAYKTTWAAGKNATFADSLSHIDRAPSRIPILSRNATTLSSPSKTPWDILRRATANRRMYEDASMFCPFLRLRARTVLAVGRHTRRADE